MSAGFSITVCLSNEAREGVFLGKKVWGTVNKKALWLEKWQLT